MDNVTPIRRRTRGTGRAGNPTPNSAEWYEAQAARWPEHADDLLAEAARIRNTQQQTAA